MKLITSLQNAEQVIVGGREMVDFKSTNAYKDLSACIQRAKRRFENLNTALKPGFDRDGAMYNAAQHAMCEQFERWFQDIIDNGNEADERSRGLDDSGND